ncbi:unnamed protein product [Phytophthora fragariaefolia]|uniref:Unnamed protein product n=1 Tax=Phytophthora fragariaefolia TaxID=1490495 RepID=A0A9W6XXT7_9STRA|nr:unnamed protein product [Phytophthora fragariaefolia]
MLFDVLPASQVVRLETIFGDMLYWDPDFINGIKVEADGYGMSLVSSTLTSDALSGPTWVGVLSKLIQCLKVKMADRVEDEEVCVSEDSSTRMVSSIDKYVGMEEAGEDGKRALVISPRRKLSISSSSSTLAKSPRAALYYADQMTCVANTREMWHYAVLFKASAQAFPGTLTLTPESDVAVSSDDVSRYFPLDDRLLIGSEEYIAADFNSQTREIQLGKWTRGA